MTERSFALLLAQTPGIGGRTVTRTLTRNRLLGRSPQDFLKLGTAALIEEYRIAKRPAEHLVQKQSELRETAQRLETRLNALGVVWITSVDAGYPATIEQMDPEPPGVLFLYGNQKLLQTRTFSVLSSRGAMPADLELIEKLAEEGVLNGEVLVCGHDRIEYQRAAVVPLRYGSPRILCLDRGLFKVLGEDLRDEAFRAARLWRYEFDPTTDLVITPFRPASDFIGINNQIRDRLIGCLSQRLDFAHINEGGNMHKIAEMALKAGRSVRVSDTTLGYRKLKERGATLVTV